MLPRAIKGTMDQCTWLIICGDDAWRCQYSAAASAMEPVARDLLGNFTLNQVGSGETQPG
jgi:hypothetical protein